MFLCLLLSISKRNMFVISNTLTLKLRLSSEDLFINFMLANQLPKYFNSSHQTIIECYNIFYLICKLFWNILVFIAFYMNFNLINSTMSTQKISNTSSGMKFELTISNRFWAFINKWMLFMVTFIVFCLTFTFFVLIPSF